MRNEFLVLCLLGILVGGAMFTARGQNEVQTTDAQWQQSILDHEWKGATDHRLTQLERKIEQLTPAARTPLQLDRSRITKAKTPGYTPASFTKQLEDDESTSLIDKTKSVLPTAIEEPETPPFKASAPIASAPVSKAAGPPTYGAPRTAGYREETTYRTEQRQRVVTESVQVPVKKCVPVQVRDVYQDVVEEFDVPVTKTVMRTETRQRTKTVMVPQQVTEDYTVSVPEQVTSMVKQTRTKRVKVGTEQVEAPAVAAAPPVQTFAAAPEPVYSAPVVTPATPVITAAAPVVTPAATPVFVSAPAPAQTFSYSRTESYGSTGTAAAAPTRSRLLRTSRTPNVFSSSSPVRTRTPIRSLVGQR